MSQFKSTWPKLLPQEIIDKIVLYTDDKKICYEFGTEFIKKKYWKQQYSKVLNPFQLFVAYAEVLHGEWWNEFLDNFIYDSD